MEQQLDRTAKIRRFSNESPCICFNLRKAARAITQVYDQMFREIGLTAGQISILLSLCTIGQMTVSELSQAMSTERTTITRNLKPLVRDDLLEISVGEDKRSRQVSITPKGRELCDRSHRLILEFQSKLDRTVGSQRVQELCEELNQTVGLIQSM